jgi:hypothetical protein
MNKEFIPYEQALALKKLGFDEPCFAFYQVENFEKTPCGVDNKDEYIRTGFATCKNSEIPEHFTSAPLFSQAFRWFREKYVLHPHFCFFTDEKLWNVDIYAYLKEYGLKTDPCTMKFKAYEEAEYACLNKLIEIAKKK